MPNRPATIQSRSTLLEEAKRIIQTDYAADLSLDDIARRVASSRRQLQRAFAEIGTTTFREYLGAVRMRAASRLLQTDGLTVREIAHRVGYRQPAQFAKAFRRYSGKSPSTYRRNGQPPRPDAPSSS